MNSDTQVLASTGSTRRDACGSTTSRIACQRLMPSANAASLWPLRIDPILEPIGFGFAESLGRFLEIRRAFPDAEMMMGIGNLTELTDADSAAINVLLLGFCQELGIRSVLTTQVINWARTSVRECDLARRLVYYAERQRTLPKRIEPRLVMLRDCEVPRYGGEDLDRLERGGP